MPISERLFYFVCGALLVAGGVVFAWGGSLHPPTDSSLGTVGSEEYFANFIRHIVQHGSWERIHAGILAGPLCWALGGVGVALAMRQRGEAYFSTLGAVALAMGATAWAVAFVFDGFAALRYAQAIEANRSAGATGILAAFEANQVIVIRLGLVGWLLIGGGMAAFGSSIIAVKLRFRVVQWVLGGAGVLLGLWPTVAWITGIFEPGPFTSRWWIPTAVLTTAWFVSMGVVVLALASRPRTPT
jgi:hypothetical protein